MRWLAFFATLLVASAAAGQMTPRHLQAVADSTVKVITPTGWGSGTVVAPEEVLTCAHVIKGDATFYVRTMDRAGKTEDFIARAVKVDALADLALLAVPHLPLRPLKVAAKDAEEFSVVWEVGAPLGHQRTASPETIALHDDLPNFWRLLGSNMQGSSGGAVVDEDGELLCVFQGLWGKDEPFGVMGRCVDRSAVVKFLGK